MPGTGRIISETGNEPEFFAEEIARVEPIGNGMVRLYIGNSRQGCLRIEYTVIIAKERLAEIGRLCLVIAAETHNDDIWLQPEVAH